MASLASAVVVLEALTALRRVSLRAAVDVHVRAVLVLPILAVEAELRAALRRGGAG